jgi:hypothetical protein
MTETTDKDVADLTKLLDGLMEEPVKRALEDHFGPQSDLEKHRRTMLAQMGSLQETLGKEAKDRKQQLDRAMREVVAQVDASGAQGAAAVRQLEEQLLAALDRVNVLAGEQQAFRDEWRAAKGVAAAAEKARAAATVVARRKLLKRLALLTPGASLFGAGLIEMIHWAF